MRYTHWLARMTGEPYRLARDAEYEKAARGGLEGKRHPWGDEEPVGRCDFGNPDGAPRPVASFPPNGYGLHDMAGSIWSWCEECFDEVAAPDQARMCYDDTRIKDVRLNPVCRGGSYKSPPPVLLCAYRHEDPVCGRLRFSTGNPTKGIPNASTVSSSGRSSFLRRSSIGISSES